MIKHEGLVERIYWLIKLRWVAALGVVVSVYTASCLVKISLPVFELYAIAVIIFIYNVFFVFAIARIKNTSRELFFANILANIQITLDLTALLALIHFSGGIENPFIFYFIFHMIIASILLSRSAAFLQASYVSILFLGIVSLEYSGFLNHYCLGTILPYSLHQEGFYIIGVSFAFITTLYIAVYMASSISKRLRIREVRLKEANELLTQKDRMKSEYVLRVTHDIKEHLAAIQTCIEPVTAGIVGTLADKQKNLLDRAYKRTGKLLFFVKALLEITRIKLSKQIRMEEFSFKDMIFEAISHISFMAKKKNISVTSSIAPSINKIKGARVYIQEAISNLLANSAKYTPSGGKINVNVLDKGNSIFIEIKDTGIGIPEELLPNVFDEFFRAPNAKKLERDGTGLGLSITKQIIQRHNGKIWVDSQLNKGTTFSILLPK